MTVNRRWSHRNAWSVSSLPSGGLSGHGILNYSGGGEGRGRGGGGRGREGRGRGGEGRGGEGRGGEGRGGEGRGGRGEISLVGGCIDITQNSRSSF